MTALLPLATLLATLLVWPQPAQAADTDPLEVILSSVAPSSIPQRGPIVISGQVRNPSGEVWEQVRVYPVFATSPMTTTDELTEAVASDPLTTASGNRLTDEGQFTEIDRLEPGESAGFRIRLARRDLPISGQPGVYWMGAQALGTNAEGRDTLADGRARSFLSLVPRRANARLALVAPLRQHVERDVKTRVADEVRIAALFGSDGRLGRVLDTLGGEPGITWLLDPALLDVAGDLADNNTALSLGPEQAQEPDDEPSTDPSASPGSAQGSPAPKLDEDARQATSQWLARATTTLARAGAARTLTLPYADPDVMGLLRHRPSLLERAHQLAANRLEARDLAATPAIATPNRRIDTDLLPRAADEVRVLAAAPARSAPAATEVSGHRVLLTRADVATGGPGPGNPLTAFNMRQRILAESALHAISGARDPLVVTLPDDWDPGARWALANFTRGLRTDWLGLTPLSAVPVGAADEAPEFGYTRADRRAEIDRRLVGEGERLMRNAAVLSRLLDTDNNVSVRLRGMALAGLSYTSRGDQASAASLVTTMTDSVRTLTRKVSVQGTQFVTLSGGSGTITISLSNQLPQPVKIGLDINKRSAGNLVFEDTEQVTLQPEQRTTMRLQVRTSNLGINQVTISPTTTEGDLVGTPLEVTIRSSEVGKWFWSVMVGAGAVLVVMIGRRIRDRIRTRHWRPEAGHNRGDTGDTGHNGDDADNGAQS